jgi:hypothetical protein
MKRTRKYTTACEIATLNHTTQDDLYSHLNHLGFWWDAQKQIWERNDQLAEPPSKLIKIRVWTATDQVEAVAASIIEAMATYNIHFLEGSRPFQCRPPQQNDSRIYLMFADRDSEE